MKIIDQVFFESSLGQNLFPTLRVFFSIINLKIKNEKPGKNYNSLSVGIQIFIAFYIIFFFTNMSFEGATINFMKYFYFIR